MAVLLVGACEATHNVPLPPVYICIYTHALQVAPTHALLLMMGGLHGFGP